MASGFHSISFEQQGVLFHLHEMFWKGQQQCRVSLLRNGRTTPQTSSEIHLLPVLLDAIS